VTITGIPRIPFLDLSRQHKEIAAPLAVAVDKVISQGRFILAEEVSEFEQEWATYCGTSACAGVASGTDAISLALSACGKIVAGRGDEVITSALSAGYTALAILQAGAVPVFADVDPETLLLDPSSVESRVTSQTRAIVPVHLYGRVCEMQPLADIAVRYGLAIVEDAAQAHGAWKPQTAVFELGSIAAFSFYPTKNLGACGDGGAVVSNDTDLISRVKLLREGGHENAYWQSVTGRNSRLDELQAAILRVKLPYLAEWNERRRKLSDIYDLTLASSNDVHPVRRGRRSAHHLYVVVSTCRDDIRRYLRNEGIETVVHYPFSLDQCSMFGRQTGENKHAERASSSVLSLPMNSHTTVSEVAAVCDTILRFRKQARSASLQCI